MKCPMTFNNPCSDRDEECRGDKCMWYVHVNDDKGKQKVESCAVALSCLQPCGTYNFKKKD